MRFLLQPENGSPSCSATGSMATIALSRRLKGHADSVLCCVAMDSSSMLASGGEDGRMCIHDLRSQVVARTYQFDGSAVASLCFKPGNQDVVYAAAGRAIYCVDTRLGTQVSSYEYNEDDINQVAVNRKGTYLAACDDTGETKIIDTQNGKLYKTLQGGHTNICSSVQFHPQRPWEVITGGLDCKIIKWDFNRGKPLTIVDTGSAAVSASTSAPQVCNPPLVHALACPEKSFPGESGRLVAVARGDCAVEVYDMNFQEGRRAVPKRHFSTSNGGHTASVSHVAFARFCEPGSQKIISGGNDGCLKVWDCAAVAETDKCLRVSLDHGKKVNWIATTANSAGNLVVADTSKLLTVYTVQ